MTTPRFAAIAAALLFSTAAGSALAATDTPAATSPATQPAALRTAQTGHDPNEVVCKHQEEIGTRLGGSKVCHTRAQWANMARDSADTLNNVEALANHSNPGGH